MRIASNAREDPGLRMPRPIAEAENLEPGVLFGILEE
jgi:hypothetical protein